MHVAPVALPAVFLACLEESVVSTLKEILTVLEGDALGALTSGGKTEALAEHVHKEAEVDVVFAELLVACVEI